jgi:hypothetical protein
MLMTLATIWLAIAWLACLGAFLALCERAPLVAEGASL